MAPRDTGAQWGGSRARCDAVPRCSQVVLALRALQRYRLGTDMSLFTTEQFGTEPSASYPGYPGGSGVESTETYQSPPFSESLEANPKGYQVPAY